MRSRWTCAFTRGDGQTLCRRIVLGASYGFGMGMVTVAGMLKASLRTDDPSVSYYATLIPPVHYGMCMVPIALLNWGVRRFNLQCSIVVQTAAVIQISGLLWSSFSQTGWQYILSNGVLCGFANCLFLQSGLHGVYTLFPRDQIPLSLTLVSSGGGLGILLFSSFYMLENIIGWRWVQRMQATTALVIGISSTILHPRFSRTETKQKNIYSVSKTLEANTERITEETKSEEGPSSCCGLLGVFRNVGFCLVLIGSLLNISSLECVFVLQPLRMIGYGHELQMAASAFAIHGAVKTVVQLICGLFASSKVISACRQFQTTSFIFGIFTLVTVFRRDLWTHSIYVYHTGFINAVLSIMVFILIAESCEGEQAGFGKTVFMTSLGVVTVAIMASLGVVVEVMRSHAATFLVIACMIFSGLFFIIAYEVLTKLRAKTMKPGNSEQITQF